MVEKTVSGVVVVNLEHCLACRACETACALAHAGFEDVVEAVLAEADMVPRVHVLAVEGRAVPVQCQHCEDAPCVAVCPSDALHREEEGGPVLTAPEECIGCKACVNACPYGAIHYNARRETVIKCDLCEGIIEEGDLPACVVACPTHARAVVGREEAAPAMQDEYRARVQEVMGGGVSRYTIDPEECICCGRCAKECPVDCISGTKGKPPGRATVDDVKQGKAGEPFSIDQEICIRCGICEEVCPVDAVMSE
jgi:carbon-monoxide dehydrogenase iron sulfur subunit